MPLRYGAPDRVANCALYRSPDGATHCGLCRKEYWKECECGACRDHNDKNCQVCVDPDTRKWPIDDKRRKILEGKGNG